MIRFEINIFELLFYFQQEDSQFNSNRSLRVLIIELNLMSTQIYKVLRCSIKPSCCILFLFNACKNRTMTRQLSIAEPFCKRIEQIYKFTISFIASVSIKSQANIASFSFFLAFVSFILFNH
jgi:hypothetical protein